MSWPILLIGIGVVMIVIGVVGILVQETEDWKNKIESEIEELKRRTV